MTYSREGVQTSEVLHVQFCVRVKMFNRHVSVSVNVKLPLPYMTANHATCIQISSERTSSLMRHPRLDKSDRPSPTFTQEDFFYLLGA